MSNNKTIQLNPIFFPGSGSKSLTPKRQKKEKPQVTVKPNKMKKQLLAKIKDFQNKTENAELVKQEKEKEEFNVEFADEFNKSLNFLSELANQRKHKPKRNETLKKGKIEQAVHLQISTELPEELRDIKKMEPVKVEHVKAQHVKVQQPVKEQQQPVKAQHVKAQPVKAQHVKVQQQPPVQVKVQPQTQPVKVEQPTASINDNIIINNSKPPPGYSNLKGGSKPTYRQYHNKTQKNYGHEHVIKPLIQIENANDDNDINPVNPVNPVNHVNHVNHVKPNNVKPPRFKKRITRTLKYSLGKHKNGTVSVLIKNAKTRRKIQTEQALLKQKSISDIKIYLREKNLLKVGSEVPNDVLRQIYENAILAGDVTNKSKDTLIHNYFNEK